MICNHETGSYVCCVKIYKDTANFPSVLSYRRVQFGKDDTVLFVMFPFIASCRLELESK